MTMIIIMPMIINMIIIMIMVLSTWLAAPASSLDCFPLSLSVANPGRHRSCVLDIYHDEHEHGCHLGATVDEDHDGNIFEISISQ